MLLVLICSFGGGGVFIRLCGLDTFNFLLCFLFEDNTFPVKMKGFVFSLQVCVKVPGYVDTEVFNTHPFQSASNDEQGRGDVASSENL